MLALDERIIALDTEITKLFRGHRDAASIESMPGFGPILGSMLLAATGDLRAFPSAGHLAAAAGLVPGAE
ncbi:transposase [Nocardia gipuzkoensis]